MMADERESRISSLTVYVSVMATFANDKSFSDVVRSEARALARKYAAEQRDLIAQRTPAEVEQMERERGLR